MKKSLETSFENLSECSLEFPACVLRERGGRVVVCHRFYRPTADSVIIYFAVQTIVHFERQMSSRTLYNHSADVCCC